MTRVGVLGAALVALAGALALSGCAAPSGGGTSAVQTAAPPLVGTEWRLVEFVSSDDSIGTIRPGPDEVYTLTLTPDGNATMQLFCNRGTASWTSPDSALTRGSITFQPGIQSMAACPPSPLERVARDLANVRTFVIQDGRLHLNLMMDGGNYVWAPAR